MITNFFSFDDEPAKRSSSIYSIELYSLKDGVPPDDSGLELLGMVSDGIISDVTFEVEMISLF